MEFLFEFVFEFIVEGAIAAATERRVPMPLRILAAVFVVGLFGGVLFLIIFTGILCLQGEDKQPSVAVLMFLIAAIFTVGLTFKTVKHFKNR